MLTVYGVYDRYAHAYVPPAESLKKSEKLLNKNPEDPEGWYERGLGLNNRDTRDKAIAAAERAITLNPGEKKYHWLKCYLAKQLYEPEEALKILEEHAKRFPEQSEPWFQMTFVYHDVGDYEKSIACQHKIIELEPDSAYNFGALASAMLYGGEIKESLRYFDKSIEMEVEPAFYNLHDRVRCAMTLSQKALALSLLGRHDEALELENDALRLNPRDFFQLGPIVYSNVALGRNVEAVEAVEKLGFYGPDENRLHAYALLARNNPGDFDTAQVYLRLALEHPSDRDAVLCYALLGDRDKTFELMAKVIEANPHMREYYRLAPELAGLRDDPRFAALTGI